MLAEQVPEITEEQIAATQKMAGSWSPPLHGSPRVCEECGQKAVVARNDLEWKEVRGHMLLVLRRLSGEYCQHCGAKWFDSPSYAVIEQHRHAAPGANYEVSISRVGGSSLGIYFPKDVQRVMAIEAGQKAYLTPVADDVMLLQIERPGRKQERKKRFKPVDDALGI